MSTPIAAKELRCKSIGRRPISQPPGAETVPAPKRASNAPRKTIDERISRISRSGMSNLSAQDESTITVCPSRFVLQPICSRILIAASTSVSLGQLCITLTPPTAAAAARIGRALFFEPCSSVFPLSGLPPLMIIFSMTHAPFKNKGEHQKIALFHTIRNARSV